MSLFGVQWEAAANVLVETVDNLELTLDEAIAILEAEVARRDREAAE